MITLHSLVLLSGATVEVVLTQLLSRRSAQYGSPFDKKGRVGLRINTAKTGTQLLAITLTLKVQRAE